MGLWLAMTMAWLLAATGVGSGQRDDRLTPEFLLAALETRVVGLELDEGLETSLRAKLRAASRALGRGESQVATSVLGAFQREVHARRTLGRESGIFLYTADSLVAQAEVVVDVIKDPSVLITAYDLIYLGGPVIRHPKVYITYWDWEEKDASELAFQRGVLEGFFEALGGTSLLNLSTQYYQIGPKPPYPMEFIENPVDLVKDVWIDTGNPMTKGTKVDPSGTTKFKWAGWTQVSKEAFRSVINFGFDPQGIYFIVTPPDRDISTMGALAYHASIDYGGTSAPIVVVDLPYQANRWLAEPQWGLGPVGATTVLAYHELVEAMTDPYYGEDPGSASPWPSWFGWLDAFGAEIADKCGDVLAWPPQNLPGMLGSLPVNYKVPALWSNAVHGCAYTLP